ncbi:MAG: beta-ketoacyl reductase, partial [Pseudomonadota bacterium]
SRSGKIDPEARADLESKGVTVKVAALDIACEADVAALMGRIRKESNGLHGIVHAAAVIDDASLADANAARLETVLRPKVEGARWLDVYSRDFGLAHFWLYSSLSTRIGNIGQATYAIANGALEDLARTRRSEGFPALAIAWPAIADVGSLASNAELREQIEKGGVAAMSADAALDRLLHALPDTAEKATITIADANWNRLAHRLPVLEGPVFEFMRIRATELAASDFDLDSLIASNGPERATAIVIEELRREIAMILRVPDQDVAVTRALADFGFDSLIGMQLSLAVEEKLGMQVPVTALSEGATISGLAHALVEARMPPSAGIDPTAAAMADRHLSETEVSPDLRATIVAEAAGRRA